jgi:pimeloyl-ACP methyl ester carboxylesterase
LLSEKVKQFRKTGLLVLLWLGITPVIFFASTTYFSATSPESKNGSSTVTQELKETTLSNNTNIVLVHGIWSDGSIWSKVIPVLQVAGHRVVAAQLPLRSLGDDIATVKRVIEELGKPTILVGHSYGGIVITNAAYNNPNITGLVYIAALAPDRGESAVDLFEIFPQPENVLQMFTNNILMDSSGFSYFDPDEFGEWFAQDIHPNEANILAAVQKPANESITTEKSGPAAWKQVPTWFQVSENDLVIPPNVQRFYAERMNATTFSLNSSHMSPISHSYDVAQLILNAAKAAIS